MSLNEVYLLEKKIQKVKKKKKKNSKKRPQKQSKVTLNEYDALQ